MYTSLALNSLWWESLIHKGWGEQAQIGYSQEPTACLQHSYSAFSVSFLFLKNTILRKIFFVRNLPYKNRNSKKRELKPLP